MKTEIEYTDAPLEIENALDSSQPVSDFLPLPDKLVQKVEKEKITIMLDKGNLDFFRQEAKKQGVGYQTMINNLLKDYVERVATKHNYL